MTGNWSHIPRLALRIIVLAGLMYAVGLPMVNFMQTGDVHQFILQLLLGLGAVVLLPIVLFIRRMLIYLEFFIFWYVVTGIAIAAMIFGAMWLDLTVGQRGGIPIAIVLLVVGAVWWIVSREKPNKPTRRDDGHPLWDEPDQEPEFPPNMRPRPRRPAPPAGPPDPQRINKEIAARKQRLNP
ncbi:MAG: hypothetical protein J0M33_19825 [Anaerolineae bacterium]|nr:hypothetical protein [Anaerolineae bacterium]